MEQIGDHLLSSTDLLGGFSQVTWCCGPCWWHLKTESVASRTLSLCIKSGCLVTDVPCGHLSIHRRGDSSARGKQLGEGGATIQRTVEVVTIDHGGGIVGILSHRIPGEVLRKCRGGPH